MTGGKLPDFGMNAPLIGAGSSTAGVAVHLREIPCPVQRPLSQMASLRASRVSVGSTETRAGGRAMVLQISDGQGTSLAGILNADTLSEFLEAIHAEAQRIADQVPAKAAEPGAFDQSAG